MSNAARWSHRFFSRLLSSVRSRTSRCIWNFNAEVRRTQSHNQKTESWQGRIIRAESWEVEDLWHRPGKSSSNCAILRDSIRFARFELCHSFVIWFSSFVILLSGSVFGADHLQEIRTR